MTTPEIYWLAGLWEGEGCFTIHKPSKFRTQPHPVAEIGMTDEDVLLRVKKLVGAKSKVYVVDGKGVRKDHYRLHLSPRLSAGLMMTLYPLLGKRRRARIREILPVWKSVPTKRRAA